MTDTAVETTSVTLLDEILDKEFTCEAQTYLCNRPAEWMSTTIDCGCESALCDPCKQKEEREEASNSYSYGICVACYSRCRNRYLHRRI